MCKRDTDGIVVLSREEASGMSVLDKRRLALGGLPTEELFERNGTFLRTRTAN